MQDSSFHHLRNQKEVVLGRRPVLENHLRISAFSHHVRTLLHLHRSDRGHWLDAAHVDLRKLLDERKDRVELRPQWLDLLVCDGDSGEMRDATHGRGVYGHGVFLPYGWPPRAASAL